MIDWNPTGRRVYFFEPHQDDGSLFMGQVAAHHVLAGREVHVVLMSNGSTSSARQKLNGEIHSGPWWGGFHDPAREGYAPLSKHDFGLARTREWSASWLQLGVPLQRQHFGMDLKSSADLPDSVSQDYATDVLEYWCAEDIAAGLDPPGFYTMHWADPNSDHAHCGAALEDLRYNEADYADSRWLTKPEEAAGAGAVPYVVPAGLTNEVKLLAKRAAIAYGAWAPESGSFAIGMHSVSAYFNAGPLAGAPNHIVRL